jgi:hypothetical protein
MDNMDLVDGMDRDNVWCVKIRAKETPRSQGREAALSGKGEGQPNRIVLSLLMIVSYIVDAIRIVELIKD